MVIVGEYESILHARGLLSLVLNQRQWDTLVSNITIVDGDAVIANRFVLPDYQEVLARADCVLCGGDILNVQLQRDEIDLRVGVQGLLDEELCLACGRHC